MRNELEYLAEVEAYVLGRHADAPAFEAKMQTDAALRTDVRLIGDLLRAVEARGIKTEIARAKSTYTLLRVLRWLGVSVLLCTALLAAAVLYTQTDGGSGSREPIIRTQLPAQNELGGTDWLQADSVLPTLVYTLRADRDEVVETPGGVLISIPQGSLRQKNGEPISGSYELEVKEALDAATIMKAGLSTWSNGRLLETGGMFYVNMRQGGENLQIPKDAGITVSVPKQENRGDMMLFDGVRVGGMAAAEDEGADNGNGPSGINWVNPRKPVSDLVAIPMDQLNFYPPGFEAKLAEVGYPDKEKAFKDSVYLSFKPDEVIEKSDVKDSSWSENLNRSDSGITNNTISVYVSNMATTAKTRGESVFKSNCARCHSTNDGKLVGPGLRNVRSRWTSEDNLIAFIRNSPEFLKTGNPYAVSLYEYYNKSAMPAFPNLKREDILAMLDYIDSKNARLTGINPVTVLAFWQKEFDRTILATKEFEARMRYIHGTCDQQLLECYTKNMDQPLYYCDSLAAMRSYGDQAQRFWNFYNLKHGKPKNSKAFTQVLLSIFAQKQRELDAAYNRTTGAWYREQAKADQKAQENRLSQWQLDGNREQSNFGKEFEDNLCAAKKQLGQSCKEQRIFSRNVRDNYNTFELPNTGWKNVDAYVWDATLDRTAMEYTDPYTGKTASITYSPMSVTVKNATGYEIREAYLIPEGTQSFMRMQKNGNTFTESLNDLYLYGYHLVAVAYKGDEVHLYTQENIRAGNITVELKPSTKGALNAFVARNGSQRAMDDMHYELQNLQFQSAEIKRNAQRLKREELREILQPVVFPCGTVSETVQADSATIQPAVMEAPAIRPAQ